MVMKQQTVFITGSGQRIGAALARYLAAQGWNVVIHYRHSQAQAVALALELRVLKVEVGLVQGDLCVVDDMARMIEDAVAQVGPLTALVHNASVFERDDLASLTPESFALHMTVNAQAPLMLTQAFVAQLPEEAIGQVVYLSDHLRGWSMQERFLSYTLSKLTMEQAIMVLAGALAPKVRLHTVALGAILENVQDKPDTFAKIAALTPLGEVTSVEEVCEAVAYLLASKSITGQMIDLSGGFVNPYKRSQL